mgnify:FL=1
MNQVFRFCCGCTRMTLMTKGKCYFCSSQFLLTCEKDRLKEMEDAKAH